MATLIKGRFNTVENVLLPINGCCLGVCAAGMRLHLAILNFRLARFVMVVEKLYLFPCPIIPVRLLPLLFQKKTLIFNVIPANA